MEKNKVLLISENGPERPAFGFSLLLFLFFHQANIDLCRVELFEVILEIHN